MKTTTSLKGTASLLLALSLAFSACAQGTFRADLTPLIPNPDIPSYSAVARLSFDGATVSFSVWFGWAGVVPTEARVLGSSSEFGFDLGGSITWMPYVYIGPEGEAVIDPDPPSSVVPLRCQRQYGRIFLPAGLRCSSLAVGPAIFRE